MAHADFDRRSTFKNVASGAVLACAALVSTGCAVNPEFAYRFDYCMEGWNSAETRPELTVRPKGIPSMDYCWRWARQGLRRTRGF